MNRQATLVGTARKQGGTYLGLLRARLRSGLCGPEQFAYQAAEAYLADGKPMRAQDLLAALDHRYAPSPGAPTVFELVARCQEMREQPHDPTCTLTMIVRNEQAMIGPTLDSVDGIVDEIVVCDTGSSDDTRAIAARYGARILSIPWKDDFSYARNCAIRASSGDWILWMDADDRLDPSCAEALRSLWRTAAPQAAQFRIVNIRPGAQSPEFLQARLFPRQEGILFERRVHEQVVYSIVKKGLPVVSWDAIRIFHHGYADERLHRRKAIRNLRLILQDLDEHPGDPVQLMGLAHCHAILGKRDEAATAFRDITDHEAFFDQHRDVFVQAHFDLGCILDAQGRRRDAKRYLLRCLYLDPSRIEACHRLGLIFQQEKREQQAFNFFVQGAQAVPTVHATACDARAARASCLYGVAQILMQWKKYPEAEETLRQALVTFPQVVEFYAQMGMALLGQARVKDAAALFSDSMRAFPARNSGAYIGLAAVYLFLNDNRAAAAVLTKGIGQGSASPELYGMLGDIHFALGQPGPALDAYEKVIAHDAAPKPDALLWRATSSALDIAATGKAKSFVRQLLDRNPYDEQARDVYAKISLQEAAA